MKPSQIFNRTSTTPIAVPRTIRQHDLRLLTSMPAGKMVPLATVPLLREDTLRRATYNFAFEMNETVEVLLNAVNVRLMAYLVPNLAFERFSAGMDALNASYEGQPLTEGAAVVPYIETHEFGAIGEEPIYLYMGKHGKPTQLVNTAYLEAYNLIWNYRAKNRSPDIALRTRLQGSLAPAFWQHTQFDHFVPDWDEAMMDGAVPLSFVNGRLAIQGLAVGGGQATAATYSSTATGTAVTATNARQLALDMTSGSPLPRVWAEMEDAGLTISLANIDLARKTQAFAQLRTQYTGLDDDGIIDLLMDGITIPDQRFKQPILLADQTTQFGMVKRYATDAANLSESVVNGATMLNLNIRVPRLPTGGVVMIVAEVTPDQLFERQPDPYLHTTHSNTLPHYLRDELDPQKVEIVQNQHVDVDHTNGTDTFAYAPLNWRWGHPIPSIGGKFYRPAVDSGFDEDRQRIWAVETKDPVLSEDFYLCTTMHMKPFVDTVSDPFEVVGRGAAVIEGNTVFGPLLFEANGNYAAVMSDAPVERIEKS